MDPQLKYPLSDRFYIPHQPIRYAENTAGNDRFGSAVFKAFLPKTKNFGLFDFFQ